MSLATLGPHSRAIHSIVQRNDPLLAGCIFLTCPTYLGFAQPAQSTLRLCLDLAGWPSCEGLMNMVGWLGATLEPRTRAALGTGQHTVQGPVHHLPHNHLGYARQHRMFAAYRAPPTHRPPRTVTGRPDRGSCG